MYLSVIFYDPMLGLLNRHGDSHVASTPKDCQPICMATADHGLGIEYAVTKLIGHLFRGKRLASPLLTNPAGGHRAAASG